MTAEEAINQIAVAEAVWGDIMDSSASFKTAVEALEKQIPKKPIPTEEQDIRYVMNYICPSCGKHFSGTGIANYCYHCGQALDWSDNNA